MKSTGSGWAGGIYVFNTKGFDGPSVTDTTVGFSYAASLGGQEGGPVIDPVSDMVFENLGGHKGEPVTGFIGQLDGKGMIPTKDERIGDQGPLDRIIENGKAVPADIDDGVVWGDVVSRQYLDGAGGEAIRGGGSNDAALQYDSSNLYILE